MALEVQSRSKLGDVEDVYNSMIRECSKCHAYREFSISQILPETGPLSTSVHVSAGIDSIKSILFVSEQINNKVFGIVFLRTVVLFGPCA